MILSLPKLAVAWATSSLCLFWKPCDKLGLMWVRPIEDILVIHLTLIPYLKKAGELKTKPTQHSVKQLSEAGIQPNILVCRTEYPLPPEIRKKLALFCNVHLNAVIESIDADSIYDVPLLMKKEKLDETVLQKLNLPINQEINLDEWKAFLGKLKNPTSEVRIALVGKYVELPDAYKSIAEALIHGGATNECKVNIQWIKSENLVNQADLEHYLGEVNGILIAPGFGERGIEGKINACRYARENNIPFFGICLGMQCAVVEFARNVLGLENAHSFEMNPQTPYPVIDMMEEQKKITDKGGTMRLGSYPCELKDKSLARQIYGKKQISERHRHRYEFNNQYISQFVEAGMVPSGINPDSDLVEIIELPRHRYYIGVQFHPELKSTVLAPHPLFVRFIKEAIAYKAR